MSFHVTALVVYTESSYIEKVHHIQTMKYQELQSINYSQIVY